MWSRALAVKGIIEAEIDGRFRRGTMMITLGLVIALATVRTHAARETNSLSVPDIERRVIQNRERLTRWTARIRIWEKLFSGEQVNRESQIDVWFDGKRTREDHFRGATPSVSRLHRVIRCFHCFKDGYIVHWSDHDAERRSIPVSIDPINSHSAMPQIKAIDLRVIGMRCTFFAANVTLDARFDDIFKRLKRGEGQLTHVDLAGEKVYRIEYTDIFDRPLIVWIDPNRQYSVIRIELSGRHEHDGKAYRCELQVQLHEVGPERIWFPKKTEYRMYVEGEIRDHEEVELTNLTLNEPIAPEVFTLAGMDIPDGTAVLSSLYRTDNDTGWIIQEGEVRPVYNPQPELGQIVVTEKRKPRWAVYGAIAAGVVAVVVVGYYLLRRRSGMA